jgi:plastocyanin
MSKNIIITIIVIVLVILGIFLYKQQASAPATIPNNPQRIAVGEPNPSTPANEVPPRNDATHTPETITITYTDLGFSPRDVTIDQGDTVVFENRSTKAFWPASDNHPDHLIYPEFDSKKPVQIGALYSFVFERVGAWKFHNHSKAIYGGTITVSEWR